MAVNTAPTFLSGDGKIITDISRLNDTAFGIALQSDGRIVIAGHAAGLGNMLLRYDDGMLDPSFGTSGTVRTSPDVLLRSIVTQPDDKILMTGATGGDLLLVRYRPDGSLDTTFGGDGTITTQVGGGDSAGHGIALYSDGRIVVAGTRRSAINYDFAVTRYNPDGSLDP